MLTWGPSKRGRLLLQRQIGLTEARQFASRGQGKRPYQRVSAENGVKIAIVKERGVNEMPRYG